MAQLTKSFLGLTFVAFVSAASSLEPCWPACPSPEAVFPHPQDCTKFFHCAYNIPFEKNCPLGLYFSPDLLRCDFPSLANCLADPSNPCVVPTTEATRPPSTSTSVSSGTKPSSTGPPEDCKPECPTPEALLGHPRDCRKYYQCAFSVAYEKDCPAGLHFSVSLGLCDYPELAQCTATEDAPCDDVVTVAPTDQPSKPASASQTGVKRDISVNVTLAPTPSVNATKVSTAAPNVTQLPSIAPTVTPKPTLAPNGTASPSITLNETVVSTAAPKTTSPPHPVCRPTCRSSIFAHPWYCDKFFLCSNSEAYEMTCPEGLYFAEALSRCDYPRLADCTASPDKPCL